VPDRHCHLTQRRHRSGLITGRASRIHLYAAGPSATGWPDVRQSARLDRSGTIILVPDTELDPLILAFYRDRYDEHKRLSRSRHGQLEFLRTQQLLRAHLPAAPASVLDVGGGTGVHARWLAADRYAVYLIDLVPGHIEQARRRGGFTVAVGDARAAGPRWQSGRGRHRDQPPRPAAGTRWSGSSDRRRRDRAGRIVADRRRRRQSTGLHHRLLPSGRRPRAGTVRRH
jgi:hypothetical protein